MLPEHNTVRGLLKAAWIILIALLVFSLLTICIELSSISIMWYGINIILLPFILFTPISIIPTILAVVFLPRIGRSFDEAVESQDPELLEKARSRILTWSIITLIFSYLIPGAILLAAYIKAEEITKKLAYR
ncbi:MAG: hypothetical protein GXO26_07670 [Crenarchaeota archaeon]|nr:hypothetical protein [Thermoproteota archaeon]